MSNTTRTADSVRRGGREGNAIYTVYSKEREEIICSRNYIPEKEYDICFFEDVTDKNKALRK